MQDGDFARISVPQRDCDLLRELYITENVAPSTGARSTTTPESRESRRSGCLTLRSSRHSTTSDRSTREISVTNGETLGVAELTVPEGMPGTQDGRAGAVR